MPRVQQPTEKQRARWAEQRAILLTPTGVDIPPDARVLTPADLDAIASDLSSVDLGLVDFIADATFLSPFPQSKRKPAKGAKRASKPVSAEAKRAKMRDYMRRYREEKALATVIL